MSRSYSQNCLTIRAIQTSMKYVFPEEDMTTNRCQVLQEKLVTLQWSIAFHNNIDIPLVNVFSWENENEFPWPRFNWKVAHMRYSSMLGATFLRGPRWTHCATTKCPQAVASWVSASRSIVILQYFLLMKGSAESLLPMCTYIPYIPD